MIFFSADLHLGHANISEYSGRPFAHGPEGVPAMNEAIIARWNSQVAPDDSVFVLGDVAMGKLQETLPFVRLLSGRKYLVAGNHDRCWEPGNWRKGVFREGKFRQALMDYQGVGFKILGEEVTRFPHLPHNVSLHHFPFSGDSHDEDRYVKQRPLDRGQWLLHGHVHELWRQRGRQINVGIDAWGGRLVALEEIVTLIEAGPRDLARIEWDG